MAITGSEYLRYGWQLINGSRIQGEIQISHERQRDIAAYLDDYREAKSFRISLAAVGLWLHPGRGVPNAELKYKERASEFTTSGAFCQRRKQNDIF